MKKKFKKKLKKFDEKYNLNQFSQFCFDEAKNKGFHSKDEKPILANYLMNIHTEVSELWEAYRENRVSKPCDKAEKMVCMGLDEITCLEEELADIVIRAGDTAAAFNIDLSNAVFNKMRYNRSRPHRNGGKIA